MSAAVIQISTAPWRVRRRPRVSRDTRGSHLKVQRRLVHHTIVLRSRRSGWLLARQALVRFGRPWDMHTDRPREPCKRPSAPKARMRAASGDRRITQRASSRHKAGQSSCKARRHSSCTFKRGTRRTSAHFMRASRSFHACGVQRSCCSVGTPTRALTASDMPSQEDPA